MSSIVESAMHLTGKGDIPEGVTPYKPQRKHRKGANTTGIITEKVQTLICEQIMVGKSLACICRENKITESSVYAMLAKNVFFAEQYARAREIQADLFADEIIEIADKCFATQDDVAKAKLQLDARKWVCSKLHPKKYSERVEADIKTSEPIQINLGLPDTWG